jgi:hypothetical protein
MNALNNQPDNCCGTGCTYDDKWIWVGDQGITSALKSKKIQLNKLSHNCYKTLTDMYGFYYVVFF